MGLAQREDGRERGLDSDIHEIAQPPASDGAARARAALLFAEALLMLGSADAKEQFAAAAAFHAERGDREGLLRSNVGLARALLAEGDDRGRAMLENIRVAYAIEGDARGVARIDALLGR
jgi:hypothetical protein